MTLNKIKELVLPYVRKFSGCGDCCKYDASYLCCSETAECRFPSSRECSRFQIRADLEMNELCNKINDLCDEGLSKGE